MTAAKPEVFEHIAPMVIDSRSLASQLTARLRELIVAGPLPSGTQLPTEAELCERFRVGRTTVREALKQLENEGTVVVRRGRGRFVSTTPVLHRPITHLESVTDLLANYGYDVENRVLSADIRVPSAEERQKLSLPEGGLVLSLERLRLHAEEPLIYSIDVLSAERAGSVDSQGWTGSLLDSLAAKGLRPVTSVATIRAAHLPRHIAEFSGTDPKMPWLLMVQLNLLVDGSPIIYSHDYHRGDRFSFDLLRRTEQGAQ